MSKKITVAQPQVVAPTRAFDVEGLIEKAIVNNVPVDTMERILAMRRELKAEVAKEEFDRSMAKFQSECPVITKTKEVRAYARTIFSDGALSCWMR
jgi:pyruvate/2-oxoglutarate/acetoin dehydrogenase E1 component